MFMFSNRNKSQSHRRLTRVTTRHLYICVAVFVSHKEMLLIPPQPLRSPSHQIRLLSSTSIKLITLRILTFPQEDSTDVHPAPCLSDRNAPDYYPCSNSAISHLHLPSPTAQAYAADCS